MKIKSLLLLSIIPLLLIVPNLVYGSEFYVETDNYGYTTNNIISITGHVDEIIGTSSVTVYVIAPNGNLSAIASTDVNLDKTFESIVNTAGIGFTINGTYTITASYDGESTQTSFEFNTQFTPEQTIQIQTDQPKYDYGDSVFVNGIVTEILVQDIDITVLDPYGNIVYTNTLQPNADLTFDFNFNIDGILFENEGIYTVDTVYGNGYSSITFKTPNNNFFIETDKSEYYFNEIIIVSGEVEELAVAIQNVIIMGLNPDGNTVTTNYIVPNEDRTFSIETSIPESSGFGIHTFTATYNGLETETTFELIPTPILLLEIDQTHYSHGDVVFINGEVPEMGEDTDVIITVTNPDGIITYTDDIHVEEDLTFQMNHDIEGALHNEIGTYVITADYEEHTSTITFETITSNLTITTDKETYYLNSIIGINGTMTTFDPDGDREMLFGLYEEDGTTIEYWSYPDIVNEDGTFEITISTIDRTRWSEYNGDVELSITLQDHTSTESFQYINEPNMTNEALYEEITNIYRLLAAITNNEDIDQDVIVDIKEEILIIQEQIVEITP